MNWLGRQFDDAVEDVADAPGRSLVPFLIAVVMLAVAAQWLSRGRVQAWTLIAVVGVTFVILFFASRERRRFRSTLFDHVDDLNALRKKNWRQFETIVAQVLRLDHAVVYERGGFQPDGGVDLVVETPKGRLLVQCKHRRVRQVDVRVVRELAGVVATNRAAGGILVTSGTFSATAKQEAPRAGIALIDGQKLMERLHQAGLIPTAEPAQVRPNADRPQLVPPTAVAQPASSATPTRPAALLSGTQLPCPVCSGHMVRRENRANGEGFWGCSTFPHCWFTALDGPEDFTQPPTCPRCESKMVRRESRRNKSSFWGCSGFPTCKGARLPNT